MAPILAKSITSSGNSSNKLDHNHFLNKELLVPNIEEQKKIGTLLSLLSKNITLHQQEPFLCGNSVNGGVELC